MNRKEGLWRITFDTNPDDCNLACIMCEDHSPFSVTQRERINAGKPKRRMPIALVRKIVAEAKGMGLREIIPSTMGEPLLYKHFTDIIAMCHEYDVKLNLTTNGTFPIKGAQAWARLLVPVTSDVKISWNGANKNTQEKIMRGSNWEKVLANVKTFIEERDQYAKNNAHYCRVTFQLTFLKENVAELTDIIALAIDLGVDRVKGHHLWTHFDEMAASSLRHDAQAMQSWNNAVAKAYQFIDQKKLPNGKKILLENIYPLTAFTQAEQSYAGECPFLGKEAWIAADGRFNPCCAPDKERRTLGDFGNLNERTLTDIWESPRYRNLLTQYPQQAVCQKCNMRKPTVGAQD